MEPEPPFPPPLVPYCFTQNSKKRAMMEPDVIEIPPPVSLNQGQSKKVSVNEVIDLDKYDDFGDEMIIHEEFDPKKKGKAVKVNPDGFNQAEDLVNHLIDPPKSSGLGSHSMVNLDAIDSDLYCSYEDDDLDVFSDPFPEYDEYAYLQAHFDNVDIPPGIEAPIPWLLDSINDAKKMAIDHDSVNASQMQSNSFGTWSLDSASASKNSSSPNSSSFQMTADMSHSPGGDLSFPWLHPQAGQSKKKPITSQHAGKPLNLPPAQSKKVPVTSSGSSNYMSLNKFHKKAFPHGAQPASSEFYVPFNLNNQGNASNIYYPSSPVFVGGINHSPVPAPPISWLPSKIKSSFKNPVSHSSFYGPFHAGHVPPPEEVPARTPKNVNKEDVLRKFELYKQFDTVDGHSDHYYASKGSSVKQPAKAWVKRIQEEWKILENDLPESIFVRVYETRMDLLRAVIVGAEGTPYHDGLFFFDFFFPCGYPNVPPLVYYHSGGLRLNPNLYNDGKVCLSLLGTWHGSDNEKWLPGTSTVLQVLVSIQALILNQKPFFNEPGYERMSGTPQGEMRSLQYNENTFILSLRTMIYTMRRPPKDFEDFVMGHFHKHAHEIMVACRAYMEGAQVGCLVKGGVQDVDEGDKSCSSHFRDSLRGYVDMLVKEFSYIGVQDCEKYQSPASNGNRLESAPSPQYESDSS